MEDSRIARPVTLKCLTFLATVALTIFFASELQELQNQIMSSAKSMAASLSQQSKYDELPMLDLGSPLPLRRTDEVEDYATPPTTPHQPIPAPAPDVYGMIAQGNIAKREQEKVKKAKKSKKSKKNKKSKKSKKSKNAKTVMDGEEPIIIDGPVSARAVNMLKEGIKQSRSRSITLKRKKTSLHKSQDKEQETNQPMQGSPTKKPRRDVSTAEDVKDYPEGFPGLRRWREASFDELTQLKSGDWISYTRGKWPGHGGGADDASKGRKKTVCTFFSSGTKPGGKQFIRVSSIPLSGARASTVRPNQTLSWDIFPAEQWTREPKYYLMKEEENKKRLKAKARLERRQQKPKETDNPMPRAGKTVTKPQDYDVDTLESSSSSSDEEGAASDSDASMA